MCLRTGMMPSYSRNKILPQSNGLERHFFSTVMWKNRLQEEEKYIGSQQLMSQNTVATLLKGRTIQHLLYGNIEQIYGFLHHWHHSCEERKKSSRSWEWFHCSSVLWAATSYLSKEAAYVGLITLHSSYQ